MRIFVSVIHVIVAIVLIVSVLMQSSKSAGLSTAIGGGAETFFGRNKGRTMDAMFAKVTEICAIIFVITSIVLSLLLK